MSVPRECRVLSGRGLGDGPITRPEESYGVSLCVKNAIVPVCICHGVRKKSST